jgi:hypothetical protein
MRQLFVKSVIVIFTLCIATSLIAKPKTLPAIKNYAQYDLSSKKVAKMRLTVEFPMIVGGKVETQGLKDFPVEIYFDANGNRKQEIIYDIVHGTVAFTVNYEYDEKAGTVGEYCLDSLNNQVWKKMYSLEKDGSIRVKKYERWINEKTQETIFELLTNEMVWKELPKEKQFQYFKYRYDEQQTVSMRMERKYPMSDGVSICEMIDDVDGDINYVWLPVFIRDYNKAKNKKTRVEEYNLGKTVYTYQSKRMTGKDEYSKEILESKTVYKYEYDGKDWVKMIQYKNDVPISVVTRTIEYR